MEYKEVVNGQPEINEWKQRLSEEKKLYLDSDLEDYDWFGIFNDGKLLAIFQIINVRKKYSKNLNVYFNPVHFNSDFVESLDVSLMIDVIIYAFESIITICSSKMNMVKFHTHDEVMGLVFSKMADEHEGIKNVKKYGKWVEVTI